MIRIENVCFKYKRKQVFSDLSLTFEQGKIHGLLGKNGAGKSTLLYLMTGLLIPGKGKVSYRDENVSLRHPSTLREMFIVPEEFYLPSVSLRRYLRINRPFFPRFSETQFVENMKQFELESDVHLGALSMGQKKKVFMSFALATNTSLLIMDEPTNGLDIPGKSQFKKFIASNMADDRTMIISTHQVQDVEKLIDQVVILDDNRVLLNASVADIGRKLYFANGVAVVDRPDALHVSPSLQGYNALLPNPDQEESVLNLETLFNGVTGNPVRIGELFSVK